MNSAQQQPENNDTSSRLPQVAVVILNWNGREFLQQFLPSVLASTYPGVTVIVADNASSDDSVSYLRQHFSEVEILLLPENYGFAKGYNEALKKVKADYYVLLNSDVQVEPGWIEPIIQLMETRRTIGACQPKILSYHEKNKFEYAGAAGGWLDSLGYPFARGRVMEVCETDNGQYDLARACFWATGAAMFVKAEVFHNLGGFDDYFFAHQEEIDLCWRMQLSGWEVYCEPASVIYHVGGGTLQKINSRKTFLNFRNNLVMLYKNLPVDEKLWKLPMRFFLDALATFKYLFTDGPAHAWAVIKAWGSFFSWIFSNREKLKTTKKPGPNMQGIFKGSLLWEVYIKNKKLFSEIIAGK